jgi:hypothetical protein
MARFVLSGWLCACLVFGQILLASPLAVLAEDQNPTAATKKNADNPKKPSKAKDPKATEKAKTDDRMSTRGLKPPPKDADSDKPAKPEANPK